MIIAVLHKTKVLQCIDNGCFLFLGAGTRLSGTSMAVIVVLMLTDAQLFPSLSDVSRVNLEAILSLDILLDVIIAVNSARIGLQISRIHGDTPVVADLFPT